MTLGLILLFFTAGGLFGETGVASWYGGKFQGRLTANGEIFDTNEYTAAHKSLPFNTLVMVTNRNNGESVRVRINDRGPFVEGRIIDLSRAAALEIGLTKTGIAPVELKILKEGDGGTFHHAEVRPRGTRELESPLADAGTLRIQVAAFSGRGNAEALRELLAREGFDARSVWAPETRVYRVEIPGLTEEKAAEAKKRLAALGYGNVLLKRS